MSYPAGEFTEAALRPTHETSLHWTATLALSLGLIACAPSAHRASGTYAQSTDSATSSCLRNPLLCKPQPGERIPVVPTGPGARPPTPRPGTPDAAIKLAVIGRVATVAIEASLEARIRQALSECADEARSAVILKHFGDRGPTQEECRQIVGTDANGQSITRAMQLGVEQHELALQCAQERLQELKPGGFSSSPRYRIEPGTPRVQYLTQEQVKDLLGAGRGAELRGSLEPDIVIHTGSPLRIQLVYDFKFPCVNGGRPPWRKYPAGHPHQELSQKEVYETALRTRALRVVPRWGILE